MLRRLQKQYIRKKFGLKVKRIGFFGPYYVLTHRFDSQGGDWGYISESDDYGYLVANRLFWDLEELIKILESGGTQPPKELKDEN